jgi:predicted component of type VI protein secretion system
MGEPPRTTPAELKRRLEAERRGHAFIEYRDADGEQVLAPLPDEGRISIGRDPDTDVSLEFDHQVSRVHAEVERIGSDWVVSDDGLSRNGTFVGGDRVVGRRRLQTGDAIKVGSTLLVFRDPRRSEAMGTASSANSGVAGLITPAQRRVLIALCRPYRGGDQFATPAPNQVIADETILSVSAVKAHLRTLFALFEVGDIPQNEKRAALASRAMRSGVVTPKDLD